MIELDIRGLPEVRRALSSLAEDQIPYAMMTAINAVAFKTKNALQAEMRSVFDRPTPWLIRQVSVEKATKKNLVATVGADRKTNKVDGGTLWERVISTHVDGGTRQWRAAERRLYRAGILTQGWFAVPAPGAALDAYGNLPGPMWMLLLSWLNAATWNSQGALQNRAEKVSKRKNKLERQGIQVFAVPSGKAAWSALDVSRNLAHLKPGIYFKKAGKIKPVVLFVNGVTYRKRLDWYGVASRTVNQELPAAMEAAIQRAIDTAR